jgi:hypothetical protein
LLIHVFRDLGCRKRLMGVENMSLGVERHGWMVKKHGWGLKHVTGGWQMAIIGQINKKYT